MFFLYLRDLRVVIQNTAKVLCGSPGAGVACAQLKCRQAAMGIRQPPDRQVGNSSKTTDLERARTRPVRAINPTGIDGAAQQWQGRPPAG